MNARFHRRLFQMPVEIPRAAIQFFWYQNSECMDEYTFELRS